MTGGSTPCVLRLADGRALGYAVHGNPAGAPLLLLHGTPGAHSQVAIGHDAATAAGLAIIAPDRWGYGESDVPPMPSLSGFAADMAALMDHLGHAHFAVGGISGGAFNPAVGLGVWTMGLESPRQFGVYCVSDFAGAAVAALAYRVINGME